MATGIYPDRSGTRNANWRGGFQSTCTQCGTNVWVKPSRAHKTERFCSKPCHFTWMSANIRREKTSAWKGGDVLKNCAHCGEQFTAPQLSRGKTARQFCSIACVTAAKTSPRIERQCVTCTAKFIVTPKNHSARFCSYSCKAQSQRKVRTAKDRLKRKLDQRVSTMVWQSLRHGTGKGGRSWKILVPYTVEDLRKRLHKTMPKGYTWTNFLSGELQIDHIIPRSAFNYSSPEDYDFQRCWALSNLQLLPAYENNSKGSKLSQPFQPTLL